MKDVPIRIQLQEEDRIRQYSDGYQLQFVFNKKICTLFFTLGLYKILKPLLVFQVESQLSMESTIIEILNTFLDKDECPKALTALLDVVTNFREYMDKEERAVDAAHVIHDVD